VTGLTDEAGVRYGSYAYDDPGRVTRSELASDAEPLDFAYGTDASGYRRVHRQTRFIFEALIPNHSRALIDVMRAMVAQQGRRKGSRR
jgi:hypothetical protein